MLNQEFLKKFEFAIAKGCRFCYTTVNVKERLDWLPLQSSIDLISRQIGILWIARIITLAVVYPAVYVCIMICLFFCPYNSAP